MKTLTEKLSQEIKKEYVGSDLSISGLAKKHGVSRSTLRDRAYKEDWEACRQKVKLKAAQKFETLVAAETAGARAEIQKNCQEALSILAAKTLKNAALISDDDTYGKRALVGVIKNIKDMGGFDLGDKETNEVIIRFESMEGVDYEQ